MDQCTCRYITGFTSETSLPAVGTSLDGLLNRTALMDVPFRGLQRQEALIYLAGLDNPSLPDDPDESVAFQAYPAYDMLEAGFTTYNQVLAAHLEFRIEPLTEGWQARGGDRQLQ